MMLHWIWLMGEHEQCSHSTEYVQVMPAQSVFSAIPHQQNQDTGVFGFALKVLFK